MTRTNLLKLVDTLDFRTLFIEELGWLNPDRPDLTVRIAGKDYVLTQIAGYKGLRIWHHAGVPPRPIQRAIDFEVGRESTERLLIFTGAHRQDWRWPRRAQLGSTNAKLVIHEHTVGIAQPDLERRLRAISVDLDEDLSLVQLLTRMRDAFDVEAETASVQAARLMNVLYGELAAAEVPQVDATLTLARLLFLLFGDNNMWTSKTFDQYIREHTAADTLHLKLVDLFDAVDTDAKDRALEKGNPLAAFRYINGGLYTERLKLPPLSHAFRDGLLAAGEFEWALISPAIFGSMFQTVKSKEARRAGGEHYTTEENILKTVGPLFLDELRDRLDRAWDDKRLLTELHNHLGRLRFLDPACGCGNFLIIAYRELRALELDLLKRRRDLDELDGRHSGPISRSQRSLDVTGDINVKLDHFYGIEIEEWPARIAETAMLLVDHLANQRMEEEFGVAPDRLPIRVAPTIRHANALHADWADLLAPSEDVIILGNPPFIGQYTKTPTQTVDAKAIWGKRYNGYLDYVTCWYAKTIDYFGDREGRWAYVSTNSICQGEPVEYLWRPILEAGWRCRFAHRSFQWVTEAPGGAAVHVSIVGFDKRSSPRPMLSTYAESGKGAPTTAAVARINPYLAEGPNILVTSRTAPLSRDLPPVIYGNKPTDDGNLIVDESDHAEVAADPIAAKYLRRYVGARELLHDRPRWCLWLVDASTAELTKSPVLRSRIAAVQVMRKASTKAATRAKAATPHLFDERRHPSTSYLAIPAHVGENRRYFTAARYSTEVICSNANFLAPDPDGFILGVLSSAMFIAWMRAIGGRIKSDLRFSNTYTYNNFPLPDLKPRQRAAIVASAAEVVASRAEHSNLPLADLYEPNSMPAALIAAHTEVDRAVDAVFGRAVLDTEAARQRALFRTYATLTGQEALLIV